MKNYTAIIRMKNPTYPDTVKSNGVVLYGFKAKDQDSADKFLIYKFDLGICITAIAMSGVYGYNNQTDTPYLLPNQEIYN